MVQLNSNFENKFLNYLGSKNLDSKTVTKYLFLYHKFLNNYSDLNQENINTFITHNPSSSARSMLKNLITSIKISDFSDEIKGCVLNLVVEKKTGKIEKKISKFIKKSDIDRLDLGIQLFDEQQTERLKLMILVQFYAGLRVSELIGLTTKDLNDLDYNEEQEYQTIKISSESAKFGEERLAYLPTWLYNRLMRYVQKYSIISDKPIWDIKKTRYTKLLNDWTQKILGERYNTHSLRHGRGHHLIAEGKDIALIKEVLGHKDISNTQIYAQYSKKQVIGGLSK